MDENIFNKKSQEVLDHYFKYKKECQSKNPAFSDVQILEFYVAQNIAALHVANDLLADAIVTLRKQINEKKDIPS